MKGKGTMPREGQESEWRPLWPVTRHRRNSRPTYRKVVSAPLNNATVNFRILLDVARLPADCWRWRCVGIHLIDSVQRPLHLQIILLRICTSVGVAHRRPLRVVHCGCFKRGTLSIGSLARYMLRPDVRAYPCTQLPKKQLS